MTPTAPEVTRLKPCPFCGNDEAFVVRSQSYCEPNPVTFHYSVGCKECGAMTDYSEAPADDRQYAIDIWNTRTLSDPDKWAQQNPEAWEALRTGRAQVVKGRLHPRRIDVPFKSEAKEGV